MQPRLQELNPLLVVSVCPDSDLESEVARHDVVCASSGTMSRLCDLNATCRRKEAFFICVRSCGWVGSIFEDVGDHFEYQMLVWFGWTSNHRSHFAPGH